MNKIKWGKLAGILAVAGLLLILAGCGEQKKNAADYISAQFHGLNGDGTVTLSFDRDKINAEISEKKKLTEREIETLDKLLSDIEKDYIISQKTGLSNGDTVEITGGLDKELLKNFGILFENDKISFTVEGLTEKVEIPVNEYIQSNLYGFDGYGTCNLYLDYNGIEEAARAQIVLLDPDASEDEIYFTVQECLRSLGISPNYWDGLSNGDQIQAKIQITEDQIPEYGITFTVSDYEETVQGLAPFETVELADYLVMELNGYDTFATASYSVDMQALKEDLKVMLERDQRTGYTTADENTDYDYEAENLAESVRSNLRYSFRTEVTPSEALKNGDQVTITCRIDNIQEDSQSEFGEVTYMSQGLILKGGSASFEVEGLAQTTTFDLSPYVSLQYQGFNGQGTAYVQTLDEEFQQAINQKILEQAPQLDAGEFNYGNAGYILRKITTDADTYTGLSDGDSVTVHVSSEQEGIPEYGIIFTTTPVEDVVHDLVPEITVDLKDIMIRQLSGFDGAGTLQIDYSEEALREAVKSAFEENGRGMYGMLEDGDDPAAEAEDVLYYLNSCRKSYFELSVSKTEKIANGDIITISYSPTEGAGEDSSLLVQDNSVRMNKYGIWLQGFEMQITAGEEEPLTAPQEINLADAVTVTFSGICPYVTAHRTIDDTVPYLSGTSLKSVSGDEAVKAENGDTYSCTIPYDEEALLQMGYKVTNDTVECEITGLETWSLKTGNPAEEWARLKEEAQTLAWDEFDNRSQDIINTLTQNSGWMVREDAYAVTEETWYAPGNSDTRAKNIAGYLGRISVPVRGYDREVTWEDMYYICALSNIVEGTDGLLHTENTWQTRLYYDRQEAKDNLKNIFADAVGATAAIHMSTEKAAEKNMTLSEEPVILPEQVQKESVKVQVPEGAVLSQAAAGPVYVDGHAYYRFDLIDGEALIFDQAMEYCENAGGHLATITSRKEDCAAIYLMREGTMNEYWLGATDKDFEGDWRWVTGEDFIWKNWSGGQPDNYKGTAEEGENCLCIYTNGTFNDLDEYSTAAGFILEMEPAGAIQDKEVSGEPLEIEASRKTLQDTGIALTQITPSYIQGTEVRDSVRDSYGNVYFESIALDAYNRAIRDYDLKGAYQTFSFTLSTTEDADSEAIYELTVWGDDQLLYAAYNYTRADAPVDVNLDISGVNRLSIQSRALRNGGWLLLNDAALVPADAQTESDAAGAQDEQEQAPVDVQAEQESDTAGVQAVQEQAPVLFLRDIPVLYSSGAEILTGKGNIHDTAGRTYRDGVVLTSDPESEITFRLDGTDAVLNTKLAIGKIPPQGKNAAVIVQFIADTVVIGEYRVDKETGVVPAEIPLSGTGQLTIRVTKETEEGSGMSLLMGDFRLTAARSEGQDAANTRIQSGEIRQTALEFPEPGQGYDTYAAALTCGNYRYFRYDCEVNYKRAKAICTMAGGVLANPKTPEEERAIQVLKDGGIGGKYYFNSKAPDDIHTTGGFILQMEAVSAQDLTEMAGLTQLEAAELRSCNICEYTIGGNDFFPYNMWFGAGDRGYAVWELGGKYQTLTAGLEVPAGNSINTPVTFAVFADARLIYSCVKHTGDETTWISLDLTGVHELRIMTASGERNDIYLINPLLEPDPSGSAAKAVRLHDLTVVDSAGTQEEVTLFTDDKGDLYDRYLKLNAGGNGYILYNLNGEYSQLFLEIVSASDTDSKKQHTVRILIGDNDEFTVTFDGRFGGTEVELANLSGAQTLRIEAVSEESSADWIYIVEDVLER